MRRIFVFTLIALATIIVVISACTHKPQLQPVVADNGYPDSIGFIIQKCATAGCHDQASYQVAAAGLLLDTWGHMFNGSNFGAEVVAYSAGFSNLLAYCNASYDTNVPVSYDPNHFSPVLTARQYNTLQNWIAKGAPDKNGNIPFAANPDTRQKIYMAIGSTCNQVAVIDAQSKLIMRYITVGDQPNDRSPHDVAVSSDGMYAYVSIYSGRYVQKIDTRTDTVVGTVNLGVDVLGGIGSWSIINLSPMDTALMVSSWTSPGGVVTINTGSMTRNEKMSVDALTGGTTSFPYPHGIASNATFDTFFAALQTGNVINKFSFANPGAFYLKAVPIKGSVPELSEGVNMPDPHQIQMLPDHSRYFVTCANPIANGEVRVMDSYTDKLIDSIPVGAYPQEMAISASKGYLFVVCQRDVTNPLAGDEGSVYVIDYKTLQVVKVIYGDLYLPHDVAVDEQDGLFFVCSTNLGGSTAHHAACGGANGWYTVYDLNTLQQVDNKKRYETLANPYTLSTRFK